MLPAFNAVRHPSSQGKSEARFEQHLADRVISRHECIRSHWHESLFDCPYLMAVASSVIVYFAKS